MDVTCEIFPPGGLRPECRIHNRRFPDRAPYHESFPDLASMLERAEAQLGDPEQWRLVEVTSFKKMQERTVTPTNYSELTDECRRTLSDTHTAIFRVGSSRVHVDNFQYIRMYRVSIDGFDHRECADVESAAWVVTRCLSESWWPGDDVIIEHTPRAIVHPIWDSSLMKHAVRHWADFWDESKAEFMAKTWHPSRMVQWCLDTEEQKCIAEM